MAEPLQELREIRLKKLENLRHQKINPFAQPDLKGRQLISSVVARGETKVSDLVVGRLRSIRAHGGSTFVDLADGSGSIQLFFNREKIGTEVYSLLELLDIGDFISVSGSVFNTEAGELTIDVNHFSVLTKSLRPLPGSFYGLRDQEERYRQRYVDLLVNTEVRQAFVVRTKVVTLLREILNRQGFLEVETPILQPIYGGATASPFTTHHNSLDSDFFLRISDELYLKRLIVGGFEKVYEIGKDFRNEGIDREHNPEFTLAEFYWAYTDYEAVMEFTENLIAEIVREVKNSLEVDYQGKKINFKPPWPRLTFTELLKDVSGINLTADFSEAELLRIVAEKKLQLDLTGVIGLAPLLDTLYKKIIRPVLQGPLFLIDHPYQMKPLAKRKTGDPSLAASFQLLVTGTELVNAYNELNDPLDQRQRWEEELKLAKRGLAEFQVLDEDYLRALEYGMPPTTGWGLGLDRFVAILTDSHTIKDVILFPTLRPEAAVPQGHALRDSRRGLEEIGEGPNPIDHLSLEPSGTYPSREKVLEFSKSKIKNQNLFRHLLAVEAAMKALARRFAGNEELWGNLGLLHDADWEETKSDPSRHTRVSLAWLESQGYREGPLVQALKSHNRKYTELGEPESLMEWALETCDELTGFIVSVTLIRPEKKLSVVTVDHVLKKWKEKSFAAAVDRAQIAQCEEKLGIKLEEFIQIVLEAMKGISDQLGL